MKQVMIFFVFFVAIFSFSVSDASVRIKPKNVAVTPADVMAYRIISAGQWTNALDNPNIIKPGWNLYYPLPDGNDTVATVVTGDNQTKMVKRIIYARDLLNSDFNGVPYELPVIPQLKPASSDSNSVLAAETKGFDFLFWLIVAFCVILIIALLNLVNSSTKTKEGLELKLKAERKILEITENELELTKQKLPIEAPALADENWLKTNNPVEAQTADSMLLPSNTAIAKVFGKKPDLIGQALVSTKDNATIMDFSFNRKANTGLKNVVVWLGWNWAVLKKGSKKKGWVSVGFIASICSNGFVGNPELVQSLDQLFTKIELANERNPVAYLNPKVPANANFPNLLAGLVVKFHKNNITDLRKAGAVINLPND